MPFENENLFLAAVRAYKRGWPGDTTAEEAVKIYETFLEKGAAKNIPLSAIERSKIFTTVVDYKEAIREQSSLGFFQRLSSPSIKVDASLFDGAAKEVDRNTRLSGVQFATLEMLRQNAYNRQVLDRQKADLRSATFGLTTDQVVEHVRKSEMTINFDANEFFSGKFDPGSRYLQMWERGKTVENDDYALKRDVTEKSIFMYRDDVEASDRPYYAGINIGRRKQGSAGNSTYGVSCFILKEEVKERSTFTPSDTFNIASYVITDEAIAELNGKIPPSVLLQLKRIKDPLRKYKAPEFEHVLMSQLEIDDIRVIATINKYTRKEGVEWKKVATFERMERIVRWFSDQQLKAISEISLNPGSINQPVADYVEAQIHGAINFSVDVEEMRIYLPEVEHSATRVANMKAFAAKHKLKTTFFSDRDI